MSPTIAYSPTKVDLFTPCKNAKFFDFPLPTSDALLCAEMARLAYCRKSDNDLALDQNKIAAVLDIAGFSGPKVFETQGEPNHGGTHCFLAMSKDQQTAVVSFRGTDANDPQDITDDIDGIFTPWEKGGRVDQGFKGALDDVRNDLMTALSKINDTRLLITGHSLGAAMATLLASLLGKVELYTIGSPLVGDDAFVATLANVNNHRYVDCSDIVTHVPPHEFGYRHVGLPYYIAKDRSITPNPDAKFILTDGTVAIAEYPFAVDILNPANVPARPLADHAPVNYVTAIAAA